MESNIKTVMIGSISIMEKVFAEELKDKDFKEKFLQARKSILDLGNWQIQLTRKEKDEKRS